MYNLLAKVSPCVFLFIFHLMTPSLAWAQQVSISEIEQKLETTSGEKRVPLLRAICDKYRYNEHRKSLVLSLEGLALSQEHKLKPDQLYFLIYTGNIFNHIDSTRRAFEYLFAALPIASEINDTIRLAKTHFSISRCHGSEMQYDSALFYMGKAQQLALQTSDSSLNNNIALSLGRIHEKMSQPENALMAYLSAYNMAILQKDTSYIVKSLNALGGIYKKVGDWARALESLLDVEKFDNHVDIKLVLSNKLRKGNVYLALGHWERALTCFKECKVLAQAENQLSYVILSTGNIGVTYINMGQYGKALKQSLDAYTIAKTNQKHEPGPWILVNIGTAYAELGDTTNALKWLATAYSVAQKQHNLNTQAKALVQKGKIFLKHGQAARAYPTLLKAYEIGEKEQGKALRSIAARQMFRCCKSLGKTTEALQYLEEHDHLANGPMNDNQMKSIVDLLIENKTKQTEELLKLETERGTMLKKRAQMATYGQQVAIGSGSLVLIMGFFIAVGQRRKIQLKEALLETERELRIAQNKSSKAEIREKELRNYGLSKDIEKASQEVEAKERLISDMKSQMNQLLQNENIFNRSAYQELTTTILESSKDGWNEFDSDFQHLNPSFFAELKNNHPNLTGNELRLCAFVRLNLSDKEIAQVLNIAPESAKKARQRLKKKLDLDVKADLLTFVMSV